jgi:O-antigen ligase
MSSAPDRTRAPSATTLFLGLLIGFAGLARGAHEIWAASLVYLCVFFYAAAFLARRSWPPPSRGVYADFSAPLLLLFAVFVLSRRGAVNPSESRLALLDWTSAMLVFLLALNAGRGDEAPRRLLGLLVPVLWIQAGAVLLQARHLGLLHLKEATGTLSNANIQTAFFLAWVPALWSLAVGERGRDRWYWRAGLLAAAGGILLLSSATGLVGLAAGLLLAEPARARAFARKHGRPLAFLAAALGSLLTLLLWRKFSAPSMRTPSGLPIYVPSARLDWWATALRMWRANPWLGVGIGNFPSAYLAYEAGVVEHTLYAHGVLFELAAETGTLGLAAALFLAARLLIRIVRRWPSVRERRPLLLGAALLLAFSLVNVSLEYLSNLLTLALLAGLALAPAASR